MVSGRAEMSKWSGQVKILLEAPEVAMALSAGGSDGTACAGGDFLCGPNTSLQLPRRVLHSQ